MRIPSKGKGQLQSRWSARRTRNVAFLSLLVVFAFTAPTWGFSIFDTSCPPPAYGEGYACHWNSGTCEGIDQEALCIGACSYCYETEDLGEPESCTNNNDQTGQWFSLVCYCDGDHNR